MQDKLDEKRRELLIIEGDLGASSQALKEINLQEKELAINASNGLTKNRAPKNANNIPASVPSNFLLLLRKCLSFPNLFPIKTPKESPKVRIAILARAISFENNLTTKNEPIKNINKPNAGNFFLYFFLSKLFTHHVIIGRFILVCI